PKGADYTIQRLLLGTHTPPNEQNYLEVASVQLPRDSSLYDSRIHDGEKDVSANVYLSITNGYGFGEGENRINLVKSIPHSGEVNRARYMPQNHDIIATKSIDGDVYIFDLTQPSPEPSENISCTPFLKLKGHSEEGFGLSWNQYRQGHVLDTSIDTTIGYWDISGNTAKPALDSATEINTLHVFKGHESAVE
ncbi:5583_t:CDS:2, partial [Paraglomus occultum]